MILERSNRIFYGYGHDNVKTWVYVDSGYTEEKEATTNKGKVSRV